jgi:hypothetical protein
MSKLLVVGYFRFDLWAGLRLRTGRKYPAPSCLTAATAVKGMDQSPKGDVLALNALSMNKEITDFHPSIFDRET